ncbi:beta-glucosidase 17-like isoform X2 [Rhodamnia argentea]|nr:beta-glucosidase 17-like isoform X2 [Rhodamnia argentea]
MYPEKITDRSTGDVADEFYYNYKKDIALLKEIGLDSFRFSISWSRIAPYGKISRGVNRRGVDFYNNLIDGLLENGIKPFVTLLHWDVPQALEDEYGGFLSHMIIDDFVAYVNFCFQEFGDRVKRWITINEPNFFAYYGYDVGAAAPGRCSNYVGNCTAGNSATEPYIVLHNMLLSHSAAVKSYRENYQIEQDGEIGISIQTYWMTPKFETEISREAASRALDFCFGWAAHPVTYGEYPETMRRYVGSRLPKFTAAQSTMVKGSLDFMAINYYTARYVDESSSSSTSLNMSYGTDCHCNITAEKDGVPIGQPTAQDWLYIYPEGLREFALYVKTNYNDPTIYVTENGMAEANNKSLPLEDALRDGLKIDFFQLHLSYLLRAIKEGANVKGYFAWTFLDDFEWAEGYTFRFGLTFVDYDDGLKRYLKDSALWFKRFLSFHTRSVPHGLFSSMHSDDA